MALVGLGESNLIGIAARFFFTAGLQPAGTFLTRRPA